MRRGSVSDFLKVSLSSMQVCLPINPKGQSGVQAWEREEDYNTGQWNGMCKGPVLVS